MSEQSYLDLLQKVIYEGVDKPDRTGTGTKSLFGERLIFDLQEGFPLLTTKKIHIRSIIHELLWFLQGGTNIGYLQDNGVHIWDEWADASGDLGPMYGEQWRNWGADTGGEVDQIWEVINSLLIDKDSRRMVVTAWNPSVLPERGVAPCQQPVGGRQALAPCHCLFQFYTRGSVLDCQLYQRSGDIFLGVPFNIASYALLSSLVAHVTGLVPGKLICTYGDIHLYNNHQGAAEKQLERQPRELPTLELNHSIENIDDFRFDDIRIVGYEPHPAIPARVAV